MKKPKNNLDGALATIKEKYASLKIGAQKLIISAKTASDSALMTAKKAINLTKIKANNLLQKLGIRNQMHPIASVSDKDVESFVDKKLDLYVWRIYRFEDNIQVDCQYKDRNITLYLGDYDAYAIFDNDMPSNKFEKDLSNEISQKWTFLLYQILGKRYLKNLCHYNREAINLEIDSN